jgi:long-chain acyl-CoA synthetase
VEAVIAQHPGVGDVAVVGVPDQDTGEWVVAYVVRKDAGLTVDAVREHCKKSLTPYKVPKLVIFRDELPKSPVGKVLRKDLRESATTEKRAVKPH